MANPNPNTNSSSSAADDHYSATDSSNQSVISPHSRLGPSRTVSSPWKQILRGELEPIPVAADDAPSSSPSPPVVEHQVDSSSPSVALVADESAENENGLVRGNAGKKPAWNKLSNGVVEVEPVMGAVLWPALSESARFSSKSSSSDSLKGLSDGSSSIPISQGTGTASLSSQKQNSSIANSNSAPSHPVPTRQRSMRRNGANTSSNGGMTQGPGGELPLNNPSPGDHGQRSSQSRSNNDHPLQPRNSFRNRNGQHSRDGSHHHNYGNHDWTAHRSLTNRDAHMQPQRGGPRFMRLPPPPPPPPTTTPYLAPPPLRPFGPMGFPELTPIYYLGPSGSLEAVPFIGPIPPQVYFPAPDMQLHSKIVNQIDYYFSNENLVKDIFLRQNMDYQGWVPIKLIAGFKKVSQLTGNIPLILESLKSSTMVEVQGDKVRRKSDWKRWIMPTTIQFPNVSGVSSGNSGPDTLIANVQSIVIEESTPDQNNLSQVDLDAERTGETVVGGMDHSSMRRT